MLTPGTLLEGRYEVLEPVADEGAGTRRYRVRHVGRGTVHLLTVLDAAAEPALRDRFLAEGRAQAALRHPHPGATIDVVDTGVVDTVVVGTVVVAWVSDPVARGSSAPSLPSSAPSLPSSAPSLPSSAPYLPSSAPSLPFSAPVLDDPAPDAPPPPRLDAAARAAVDWGDTGTVVEEPAFVGESAGTVVVRGFGGPGTDADADADAFAEPSPSTATGSGPAPRSRRAPTRPRAPFTADSLGRCPSRWAASNTSHRGCTVTSKLPPLRRDTCWASCSTCSRSGSGWPAVYR